VNADAEPIRAARDKVVNFMVTFDYFDASKGYGRLDSFITNIDVVDRWSTRSQRKVRRKAQAKRRLFVRPPWSTLVFYSYDIRQSPNDSALGAARLTLITSWNCGTT
jgi:hypothetical protein